MHDRTSPGDIRQLCEPVGLAAAHRVKHSVGDVGCSRDCPGQSVGTEDRGMNDFALSDRFRVRRCPSHFRQECSPRLVHVAAKDTLSGFQKTFRKGHTDQPQTKAPNGIGHASPNSAALMSASCAIEWFDSGSDTGLPVSADRSAAEYASMTSRAWVGSTITGRSISTASRK